MNKEPVKITSRLRKEFSKKINLAGEEYLIDSEDLGIKNPLMITRIYHKGEVISSQKIDYTNILNEPDLDKRLLELVQSQQHQAVKALKAEKIAQNKTYGDYIKEAEALLIRNNQKEALKLLTNALEHYPNNPFIWSYQGCLDAIVDKKYSKGVNTCRHAFKILKEQMPFGEEFFFPILYLNLGKAYLAAGKRKEAYASFKKGLEIDTENRDLLNELRKLGIRRQPPLPFLKRSNPLNKYVGKLSHKLKKQALLTH
jgi:tetratricopeptide (TPR) repeat protein